jgi:hypothetical protein
VSRENFIPFSTLICIYFSALKLRGGGGGAVIDSKEYIKFQAGQREFIRRLAELPPSYLGLDPREGARAVNSEKANIHSKIS